MEIIYFFFKFVYGFGSDRSGLSRPTFPADEKPSDKDNCPQPLARKERYRKVKGPIMAHNYVCIVKSFPCHFSMLRCQKSNGELSLFDLKTQLFG